MPDGGRPCLVGRCKKKKEKKMALAFHADPPPITVRVKPSPPRGGKRERISKRKIQVLRGGQQGRGVQNIPHGLVSSVKLGDTWGLRGRRSVSASAWCR